MLTALIIVGCHWNEAPVRVSLIVDTSDLVMSIGESVTRTATSESKVYHMTYATSNPSVATVDQNGKVTAITEGEATITIKMDETREGWYAASSKEYKVIVNNLSAEKLQEVDKSTPLTFIATDNGKITISFKGGVTLSSDIHYTVNGGEEQTISKSTEGSYEINLYKGNMVQFYSTNSALSSGGASARGFTRAVADDAKYINIQTTMNTVIFGNVMSLVKGKDNLASVDAIEANKAFYGLFAGANQLVNDQHRNIALPATTLKDGCYQDMFYGCKGIERAPELPALTLVKECYKEMFYDCSKLNYVKSLATDISATDCTKDWLGKAGTEAASKKAVVDSETPWVIDNDSGIPVGWTKEIIPVDVTTITLNQTSLELKAGFGDATLVATIEPTKATDQTVTWTSENPEIATVNNGVVHPVYIGTTTITAKSGKLTATCSVTVKGTDLKDVHPSTGYYIAQDGEILTGKLGVERYCKLFIGYGATVTLKDVTIDGTHNYENHNWAGITSLGDATIILKGENKVEGSCKDVDKEYPGILPAHKDGAEDYTLTIKGDGILIASPYETNATVEAAGIGGGKDVPCGNIVIEGGTIYATGGYYGAGIGAGSGSGSCGNITIKGGKITAKGGSQGAGIGGGVNASCDDITISGGEIDATGGFTGEGIGAGIGAGNNSSCDAITITGGTITANSNLVGAGIGGGDNASCKDITISGGEITATGGFTGAGIGAGIGAGNNSSCDAITITGGTITANSNLVGAGIGGGLNGSCKSIDIRGGEITAAGGNSTGAGIGGGNNSSVNDFIRITSDVEKVTATKYSNETDTDCIGHGHNGTCGLVAIGGTIDTIGTIYWNGTSYQNGGDSYLNPTTKTLIYPQ